LADALAHAEKNDTQNVIAEIRRTRSK